jgi:guanylate kinase
MNRMPRPVFPLVISGPSGSGKTSVASWILEQERDTILSVSCTTRPKRRTEVEGVDYFFVEDADFLARRDRGEFLEWALVHGHLYGTPRAFVDRKMREGRIVLLDIDVQGAMQVRQTRPDAVLVFLMPPSLIALEERLRGRSTEADDVIQRRLLAARREMSTAPAYDYLVVNRDLEEARRSVRAIVEAERCRASRVLTSAMVECEPILAEMRLAKAGEIPENLERR